MKIQFPVSGVANRLVLTCSVHIMIWLGLNRLAMESSQGLEWLRWAAFAAALLPFHFWLVQEAMATDLRELRAAHRRRALVGLALAAGFAVLPFTDLFVPDQFTGTGRRYGMGYPLYVAGLLGMYLTLGLDGLRRLRSLGGSRRLAVQIWLGAGSVAWALIVGLMLLRVFLRDADYGRAQPFVVLACYAWTAFALTTSRTFEPRRFILIGIEKVFLVATLAAAGGGLFVVFRNFIPAGAALAAATVLTWSLALVLRTRWDRAVRLLAEAADPAPRSIA